MYPICISGQAEEYGGTATAIQYRGEEEEDSQRYDIRFDALRRMLYCIVRHRDNLHRYFMHTLQN